VERLLHFFSRSPPPARPKEDLFLAQLSISDIRQELLCSAGVGVASNALAGQIFHGVLADLIGPCGWQAAMEPGDIGNPRRVAEYAYNQFLGPRLTAAQASLRENGPEVLALWDATQAMCQWLSSILDLAARREIIRYDPKQRAWQGAEALFQPEQELRWEIREPHWTAPVLVTGVADALVRNPDSGRWCVLEYKLGQGRPEADLAQACLYHSMLVAGGLAPDDGALALLSFTPGLREQFYQSADLKEVQSKLRELVGRLAGVSTRAAEIVIPPNAIPEEHNELGRRLVRALGQYGISVDWDGQVTAGPTFLRFVVMPGRQVRVKQVTDKAEDVQVRLGLERAPIIHNAAGRLVVDVQRPDRQTVLFSSIAASLPKAVETGCSLAPIGVDLSGRLQTVDLASPNTPHLLVAGTSGSGKSEWLRTAVAGLMLANTPTTLRLLLIDPKRNAFAELRDSPYLYGAQGLIYPPEDSALDALDSLIEEMEKRYKLFSQIAVSDLCEYAAKTSTVLPRIVCICDEYADLLSDRNTAKELEARISRLGAKARAAGIHLIIATQHPDRRTVGGALKTNLGGRVCLRVTDHIQSNMIINQSGAERLLGKGDLFFLSIGDPVRLQAPYLSPEERVRIFGRKWLSAEGG